MLHLSLIALNLVSKHHVLSTILGSDKDEMKPFMFAGPILAGRGYSCEVAEVSPGKKKRVYARKQIKKIALPMKRNE